MTDLLPSSTTVLTASVAYMMTGVIGGNLYTFSVGDVMPGQTGSFTVTVRYTSLSIGQIINTGTISALPYIVDVNLTGNVAVSTGVVMIARPQTSG